MADDSSELESAIPPMALHRSALLGWLLPAAAILGVYAALSLAELGSKDLNVDELVTSALARVSAGEILDDRPRQGHGPLYFLLVQGWVEVAGHTVETLALFSALLGAFGIVATGWAARELGFGRWSWVAMGLLAVHPEFVHLGRFVRPYSGAVAFAALQIALAGWALRGGRRAALALACAGVAGALWHHSLVTGWIALGLAVAAVPALRRGSGAALWVALSVALLAHGGMLFWVWKASRTVADPLGWIEPAGWAESLSVMLKVFGGKDLWAGRLEFGWVVPLAIAGAIGWCFQATRRRPRLALALAGAVVPLALLGAVTLLAQPMWRERYLVVCLPGGLLCLVAGLRCVPWRWPRAGGIALLAAVSLVRAEGVSEERGSGLREVVARLERERPARAPRAPIITTSANAVEGVRLHSGGRLEAFFPGRADYAESWVRVREITEGADHLWVVGYRKVDEFFGAEFWRREGVREVWRKEENVSEVRLYALE
ncbi:MAG: hypothetical protein RLY93_17440 [Sumerlaeia bacterium]